MNLCVACHLLGWEQLWLKSQTHPDKNDTCNTRPHLAVCLGSSRLDRCGSPLLYNTKTNPNKYIILTFCRHIISVLRCSANTDSSSVSDPRPHRGRAGCAGSCGVARPGEQGVTVIHSYLKLTLEKKENAPGERVAACRGASPENTERNKRRTC